ncbi:MAG: hypothetical protein ABII22_04320 [Candidatus Micrarchaeota archaeon]
MNETFKKHAFPVILLILFCTGIYLAFGGGPISDHAYGELLEYTTKGYMHLLNLDVSMVRFAVLFFTFISSILVYFSFKENQKVAILAAMLFMSANVPNMVFINSIMQPLIMLIASLGFALFYLNKKSTTRYLSVLLFLAAVFLAYPSFTYELSYHEVGLLLPLAVLGIFMAEELVFLAVGIAFLYLYPQISMVVFAFTGAAALQKFFNDFQNKKMWLVFLLAFFISVFSFELVQSNIILGAVVGAMLYGVLYLYEFKVEGLKTAFIAALLLSSVLIGLNSAYASGMRNPSSGHIELYKSFGPQSAYVLAFPNSFEYYTGAKANLLTRENLLSNKSASGMAVIASSEDLFQLFKDDPIVFYFYGFSKKPDGQYVAVFFNPTYVLQVPSDPNLGFTDDAYIFDPQTGKTISTVISPRLKLFNKKDELSQGILLINTEDVRGTVLYNMLFNSQIVSEFGNVKLFKVE